MRFLLHLPLLAMLASVHAETWREPATGMEFVRVSGGCYMMGDTFGGGDHNEHPVHEACIKDTWIGKLEVTQGQWRALMEWNPAAYAGGDAYPVDSVNQADIAEFVRRLTAKNPGRIFRLPTEAEWEYACRAGGRQEKFGGLPPPAGANTAEYAGKHEEGSVPAGSFPPNALGIHDMSGNLWEWVSDVYAADAYARHGRDNPHYLAAGPARLLRGGGWSHDAFFARCSKRHMHCRPTARFDFIGFRLVTESQAQQP